MDEIGNVGVRHGESSLRVADLRGLRLFPCGPFVGSTSGNVWHEAETAAAFQVSLRDTIHLRVAHSRQSNWRATIRGPSGTSTPHPQGWTRTSIPGPTQVCSFASF